MLCSVLGYEANERTDTQTPPRRNPESDISVLIHTCGYHSRYDYIKYSNYSSPRANSNQIDIILQTNHRPYAHGSTVEMHRRQQRECGLYDS